jgi:hypothetical protein
VCETQTQNYLTPKRGVEVTQGGGPEFKRQYHRKKLILEDCAINPLRNLCFLNISPEINATGTILRPSCVL